MQASHWYWRLKSDIRKGKMQTHQWINHNCLKSESKATYEDENGFKRL